MSNRGGSGIQQNTADTRYQSISGNLKLQSLDKTILVDRSFYAAGTYEISTPNALELVAGSILEIG